MQRRDPAVRPAREEDARALLEVHRDAVHRLAAADYPAAVTAEWSPPVDPARVAAFLRNPDGEVRLAAELEGRIVGFGALVPAEAELRACYVAARAARRGVGRALVGAIEAIARAEGLQRLTLDSSLTAVGFYRRLGYAVVAEGTHRLRSGGLMACVAMRKELGAAAERPADGAGMP